MYEMNQNNQYRVLDDLAKALLPRVRSQMSEAQMPTNREMRWDGNINHIKRCCCNENHNYRYVGNETIDVCRLDDRTLISIKWNDRTVTQTNWMKNEPNEFDLKLGIMICVVYKFAPQVNINRLFAICKSNSMVKEMLKYFILCTAGKRAYRDIDDYIEMYRKEEKETEMYKQKLIAIERKKEKAKKRKQKWAEKVEKLKKEGKWKSKKEREKENKENELVLEELSKLRKIKEEREKKINSQKEIEEAKKEIEKLKKELGIKE